MSSHIMIRQHLRRQLEFNLLNVVNGGFVHVMVLAHYAQGPLEGGAKG